MSSVKQSEMDKLFERRKTLLRHRKYIAIIGGFAACAAGVMFWREGLSVAAVFMVVTAIECAVWLIRKFPRVDKALIKERERLNAAIYAAIDAATRVEQKTVAAGHEPFIVSGALADHRNWRHGEAVEWHPDGTPRRVWDRYKVTDFQGAKMVGAIVEADEKLTDPPPTATLD